MLTPRCVHGTARRSHLRNDGGLNTSFDTTASRFGTPGVELPGPGAHAVGRWSGEQPSTRRPQRGADPNLGFLSSTERFGGGGRSAIERDAVLDFLTHGPTQIGQPTHAQIAITRVAAQRGR